MSSDGNGSEDSKLDSLKSKNKTVKTVCVDPAYDKTDKLKIKNYKVGKNH